MKATLRPGAKLGAPRSWPRPASLAAMRQFTFSRPTGWQLIPCLSQWQPGGSRKASLTFARAARPKGRGGDSQEAGGTIRFPLLLCARRPRRPHFPAKRGHIRCPLQPKRPNRARNACPYGLRPSDGVLPCLPQTKRGEPHRFPLLLCARRPRRPHFPVKRGHIRCPLQPKRPDRARNARPYETRAANNTPPESQKRGEPHRVLLFSICQSLTVCKPVWSRTPRTPF